MSKRALASKLRELWMEFRWARQEPALPWKHTALYLWAVLWNGE